MNLVFFLSIFFWLFGVYSEPTTVGVVVGFRNQKKEKMVNLIITATELKKRIQYISCQNKNHYHTIRLQQYKAFVNEFVQLYVYREQLMYLDPKTNHIPTTTNPNSHDNHIYNQNHNNCHSTTNEFSISVSGIKEFWEHNSTLHKRWLQQFNQMIHLSPQNMGLVISLYLFAKYQLKKANYYSNVLNITPDFHSYSDWCSTWSLFDPSKTQEVEHQKKDQDKVVEKIEGKDNEEDEELIFALSFGLSSQNEKTETQPNGEVFGCDDCCCFLKNDNGNKENGNNESNNKESNNKRKHLGSILSSYFKIQKTS